MLLKNREIPPWILYFYSEKHIRKLSEIITGQSGYVLENTLYKRFKKFEVGGNTFQDGTPTLENEISIQNVVGTIVNKVSNKNMFDISKINNLALSNTIVESNIYRGFTLPVIVGQKISISRKNIMRPNRFRVCFTKEEPADGINFYDENGVIGNFVNLDASINGNITVPNGMKYLFLYLSNNNETITNEMEIQLEPGTTATPYVPHEEQTAEFTLLEGQRLMLGDTLEDDGIHHKRKQVVLDGTENWSFHSEINGVYRYRIAGSSFLNKFVGIKAGSNSAGSFQGTLCNYLLYTYGSLDNVELNTFSINNQGGANWFFVQTNFEDLDIFKQWLAEQYANGTPLIAEYELEEEEKVPYTATQQEQFENFENLKTYKDVTIVEATSNELSPILSIQYYENETEGGERSMKLSKEDLKKKLDEKIEDEDLKIELLEDVEDSFEEVAEDTTEKVEKTMYDELETKYDELKTKYKDRFLSSEEVKEETTEEKDEGLTEEVVYEKEDIFEDTKKEEE